MFLTFFFFFFFMFSLLCMTELGAFMRTGFLRLSVLRVTSGPRVKLAGRQSALTLPPTPR